MARIDASLRTLRARTLEILREEVVSGRLEPGQRINEVGMAADIGVSRGTLREALRNLEQEGLVVSVPHRGSFVRALSPGEAADLSEVRLALETAAACRLAHALTSETQAAVERRLAELEYAYRTPLPFPERVRADQGLHEAICAASGNEVLLRTWRSIMGSITAMVLNVGEERMTPLQDPEAHVPLLESIVTGDEVRIRETFARHFSAGQHVVELALLMREHPDGVPTGPSRDRVA